jgi:hypothetical protein
METVREELFVAKKGDPVSYKRLTAALQVTLTALEIVNGYRTSRNVE